jgi:hypothetical protein
MIFSHLYGRHRQYTPLDVPVGIVESEAGRVEKLIGEMNNMEDWRRKARIADMRAGIGELAIDRRSHAEDRIRSGPGSA